jgi:hypothetical protein
MLEIEKTLFQQVRNRIAEEARRIRQTASVVAEFDVLTGFAAAAQRFAYYGGSSMAMSLIGVGILLSVSRDAAMDIREQPSRPAARPTNNGRSGRETVDLRRRDRRSHLPRFGGRR